MEIIFACVLSLSLCMDCFAVCACSSVTIRTMRWPQVMWIALVFAVVQAGLLAVGWAFGDLFVGYLSSISRIIGFLLLAYVGGSMVVGYFRGESETCDLNGLRNVIIGAVATSIDAFSVGISLSMSGESAHTVAVDTAALFICTFASVVAGMFSGSHIGSRFGRTATLAGGIVLLLIGINVLFDII